MKISLLLMLTLSATLIAVLKGIKKYKLKKLITFHSRVKGAKDFLP